MNEESNGSQEEKFITKPNEKIIDIHSGLAILAIFLSWKCQNGFNFMHVLLAFFCPYLYIPYVLLIHCQKY